MWALAANFQCGVLFVSMFVFASCNAARRLQLLLLYRELPLMSTAFVQIIYTFSTSVIALDT
jgi:hypothetical protein